MDRRYLLLAVAFTMLQWMCHSCSANFAKSPSSVSIEVENGVEREAVFRCRHQRIDAIISWQINGSSSRLYPNVVDNFIRESNGTRVDTLTIPAIPEYSDMEVVCVATFFDGSPTEVTPSAVLMITGHSSEATSAVTTMPVFTESTSTVNAPTTPMPISAPTTLPSSLPPSTDFTVVPSPLNVTVEQGVAVFHCQHESSKNIIWNVSGSIDSTSTKSPLSGGGFSSSLVIETHLDFNKTTIQCVAIFFQGSSPFQFTKSVTLLVQGTPGKVNNVIYRRNYLSNVLTIIWDPLPTLDITDVDPDIVYTVELFMIICSGNISMASKVVNGSNATVENLDLMQIYKAVIIARNNVREARNGPSAEMEESFMSLSGSVLFELVRKLQVTIISPSPVPVYYTMALESLDGRGNTLYSNITVERNGETITMAIKEDISIPSKSLWDASVLPYGCDADVVVTELSTHDIQNVVITVSSLYPGQIRVTGDFVNGSTATGVLLIVYSLTNESDVHYIAKSKEQDVNKLGVNVNGLYGTTYKVSAYALENGTPFPRVVTRARNVTMVTGLHSEKMITGKTQQLSTPIEYDHHPTDTGVCISCTIPDSTLTDCVAVVHQRISRLSSSGLMNIESSHKFARSGDTAYGCIEGVNLDQYQVGVIGVKVISPIIQSNDEESSQAGAIAGTVLGVIAFVLIVAVMMILYMYLRKHITKHLAQEPLEDGTHLQSDMIVNIENATAASNPYVESGQMLDSEATERPSTEDQSLLTLQPPPRVMEDGVSTPPLPPRVMEDGVSTPPLPQRVVEDGVSASPLPQRVVEGGVSTPPLPPRVMKGGVSTPPLPPRVMEDSMSTPPAPPSQQVATAMPADASRPLVSEWASYESGEAVIQHQDGDGSPHDQGTSVNGCSDPTYSQLVLTKSSNTVSPPAMTDKLIYEIIGGFQNQKGQVYALPQLKSTSKGIVDDLHEVVYSKVQLQPKTWGEATSTEPTSEQPCDKGIPPTLGPPTGIPLNRDCLTAELLFSHLLPLASKWQSLGLALSLDEDRLDDIFTNNETDEACLREMLELYMMRSDLSHSLEEIEAALKKDSELGVQESDSSSTSPVINGSIRFPSDIHAKSRDLKSVHIADVHTVSHCQKSSHIPDTALGVSSTATLFSGRRWHSLGAIPPTQVVRESSGIHDNVDYHDFMSEPNLPYAQGCAITQDHIDIRNGDSGDHQMCTEMPRKVYLHADHGCSLGLFVTNKDHDEELLKISLVQHLPSQESHMDTTDYKTTLKKQLGINRQNLTNTANCQQLLEEDSLHNIHIDNLLAPTQEPSEEWTPVAQLLQPLNCINVNQGVQYNQHFLKLALTQEFNSRSQEPLLPVTKTPIGQWRTCTVHYQQILSPLVKVNT